MVTLVLFRLISEFGRGNLSQYNASLPTLTRRKVDGPFNKDQALLLIFARYDTLSTVIGYW